MRIKKFRAKSMIDALRKVKNELGEEAVILDSGKIRENGEEFYEVIAAVEEREEGLKIVGSEREHQYSAPWEEIKRELCEIKQVLKELRREREEYIWQLRAMGIPEGIAREISIFDGSLEGFIRERLRLKGVSPPSRIQIFIGEAGVGKTTGIFKIAFMLRHFRGKAVTVLSLDNYKVGAREEAQKLAQLLEIPLIVGDLEDLSRYLSLLDSQEFLLIDTPSLGKRFTPQELSELYEINPAIRFNWVVRATDDAEINLALWEELKRLPIDALVLTFVDRKIRGSKLFWILQEDIPPVAFISRGERIPEDLEISEIEPLVKIFLKNIEEDTTLRWRDL